MSLMDDMRAFLADLEAAQRRAAEEEKKGGDWGFAAAAQKRAIEAVIETFKRRFPGATSQAVDR